MTVISEDRALCQWRREANVCEPTLFSLRMSSFYGWRGAELVDRRALPACSHLCPVQRPDGSDRDWKVHGVSCPSAHPGDHAVPCLSEQCPAIPRVGTSQTWACLQFTCVGHCAEWMYIHFPFNHLIQTAQEQRQEDRQTGWASWRRKTNCESSCCCCCCFLKKKEQK